MKYKMEVRKMKIDINEQKAWFVNLIPFSPEERSEKERILAYQKVCIQKSIFGMGWAVDKSFDSLPQNVPLNDYTRDAYYQARHDLQYSVGSKMKSALNYYMQIKVNDLVVMRLKDSHYYIGRVKTAARYCDGLDEQNRLSWYCEVYKWIHITDEDVPSAIIGKFSQSRFSYTICKADDEQKNILSLLYNYEISNNHNSDSYKVQKVQLTIDNFCSAFDPDTLEDLVATFIFSKHPTYVILPSSCKKDRPKYEFLFVDSDNKPITCQVKNKKGINVNDYFDDVESGEFEKIYLFSGIWNQKQNSEIIRNVIYIISHKELFEFLTKHTYMRSILERYYQLPDDIKNT